MNEGGRRKQSRFQKKEPEKMQRLMGERIKALRIAKGYSSYETFAYEHDIPRAQLGRYEKGQDLRFSSLVRLANAFEITLEEFFSEGFD